MSSSLRKTIDEAIERANRESERRAAGGADAGGEDPYVEIARELRGGLAEVEFLAEHAHEYGGRGKCIYCGSGRPARQPVPLRRPALVPAPVAKAEKE